MPHYCTLPVKTNLCLVSDNHDDRLFKKNGILKKYSCILKDPLHYDYMVSI